MHIDFDTIELAFGFVSSDRQYVDSAFLCKKTGQTYFVSEFGDSDELPDDIDDAEHYLAIPHKNELEPGMPLVRSFVSANLPDQQEKIASMFRRKGAYRRFKHYLEESGLLEAWYHFEERHTRAALKAWCQKNGLVVDEAT